jgi:hypothetical protein
MSDQSKRRKSLKLAARAGACLLVLFLGVPVLDFACVSLFRFSCLTLREESYWDGGSTRYFGLYYTIFDGRLSFEPTHNRMEGSILGLELLQLRTKPRTDLDSPDPAKTGSGDSRNPFD